MDGGLGLPEAHEGNWMTPYRERREKGLYDPKGKGTQSTTTENLAGLGASQQTKQQGATKKK